MKYILSIVLLILLVGCNPAKRAARQTARATAVLKQHGTLNDVCAENNLDCRDSVSIDIDSIRNAFNENLSNALDSLELVALDEIDRNESARKYLDSMYSHCRDVIDYYESELDKQTKSKLKILDEIVELKKRYRPCKPDTVFKTVWRRDLARESVLGESNDSLRRALDNKTGEYNALKSLYDADKKRWRGKIGIPWWVFVVLGIGVFLQLRFRLLKL